MNSSSRWAQEIEQNTMDLKNYKKTTGKNRPTIVKMKSSRSPWKKINSTERKPEKESFIYSTNCILIKFKTSCWLSLSRDDI